MKLQTLKIGEKTLYFLSHVILSPKCKNSVGVGSQPFFLYLVDPTLIFASAKTRALGISYKLTNS